MKKYLLIFSVILLLLLCSCGKDKKEEAQASKPVNENIVQPEFTKEEYDKIFNTDDIIIVKTYMESPTDEAEQYLAQGKIYTTVKHYLLSDGSWKTDSYSYKYKLILTGRLNNAEKDSTYEVLSNNPDITFDMAWKASGLSSNSEDYFKEEDAIIVAIG